MSADKMLVWKCNCVYLTVEQSIWEIFIHVILYFNTGPYLSVIPFHSIYIISLIFFLFYPKRLIFFEEVFSFISHLHHIPVFTLLSFL
jgi:hypothetical protein